MLTTTNLDQTDTADHLFDEEIINDELMSHPRPTGVALLVIGVLMTSCAIITGLGLLATRF